MIFGYFSDKNEYFDLFLDGVQRYKDEYDVLAYAKQLYFRKIKDGYLDFDKFYNYYKWLDGAVSEFVSQLVAIKKQNNNKIINTIEHHALERTKISYKRSLRLYDYENSLQSEPILPGTISADLYLACTQNDVNVVYCGNDQLRASFHLNSVTNPYTQHSVMGYDFEYPEERNGNYFRGYDVVNTCGRYENNKFNCLFENYSKTYSIPNQSAPRVFFDREFSLFSYNYCYSNFVSESARARGETVFVNRFNSPGDVMTSSRRCDVESLEKSVYNDLNFRNLSARSSLSIQWMVG